MCVAYEPRGSIATKHVFKYWRLIRLIIPLSITISIIHNEKSLDGMLGIQTCDRRIVGVDKTTELWWPSLIKQFYIEKSHL